MKNLDVLDAAIAYNIATDRHQKKVSKQIKRALNGIQYRAKHGYYNIKFVDMDKDVGTYLTSIGYSVRNYYDMDDDYITVVQWEEVSNAKHN